MNKKKLARIRKTIYKHDLIVVPIIATILYVIFRVYYS